MEAVPDQPPQHFQLSINLVQPRSFLPRLVRPDDQLQDLVARVFDLTAQSKFLMLRESIDYREQIFDKILGLLPQNKTTCRQDRSPDYRLQTVTGKARTNVRAHVPRGAAHVDSTGTRADANVPVRASDVRDRAGAVREVCLPLPGAENILPCP